MINKIGLPEIKTLTKTCFNVEVGEGLFETFGAYRRVEIRVNGKLTRVIRKDDSCFTVALNTHLGAGVRIEKIYEGPLNGKRVRVVDSVNFFKVGSDRIFRVGSERVSAKIQYETGANGVTIKPWL